MALSVTRGKIARPQKVVIYGSEGIGKTTLASQFPDPVFIDMEDGTAHFDVKRISKPSSWEGLIATVNEVASTANICTTLVIDTADCAEQVCTAEVCKKYRRTGIEEFGYGKGYTYVAEEFARLLDACDNVIKSGKHVVITAHAKMRKFELPDEQGQYDRWEMKLSKQTAPLLKEWCDMLLFCNYKTYIIASDNPMTSGKAQGGKRVIYTSHHPCWDAKNRHGLPDEMDMSYAGISHIFRTGNALEELGKMMAANDISEDKLREVISRKGQYDLETPIEQYSEDFISGWIIPNFDKIVSLIRKA